MANLILRTRLDMLSNNLGEVRDVLQSIEEERHALRTLVDLAGEKALIQEKLTVIQKQSKLIGLALLEQLSESTGSEVDERLDAIEENVKAVKAQLREVADTAAQLMSRALPIPEELEKTLQEQLIREAEKQIGVIEELSRRIDEASLAQAQQPASAEAGRETWRATAETGLPGYMEIRDRSRKVFGEYVDFVGGLALRDTGFDRGICRIADEFFKAEGRWGDVQWSSLTIPAREEVRGATMARIIRLGFPEWTIWALPLAAHEFGHVVIETYPRIEEFITKAASDDRARAQLRICLADAFATYFMGPAYAWAAILMRFDPLAAFDEDDAGLTQRRVETVLAMLRRMDPGAGGPCEKIAGVLLAEWQAAVAEAGAPAPQAPPAGSETDSLIASLVESIPSHRALPIANWSKIEQWATWLWDENRDPNGPSVGFADDIRYLLNAAWSCRAKIYGESSAAGATARTLDGLKKLAEIRKAGDQLWELVEEKRRGRPQTAPEVPSRLGAARESPKPPSVRGGQEVRT